MILSTQRLKNGRKIYVNAFTGREVMLDRMIGSGTQKLPDYAFRFISPQPKSKPRLLGRHDFPQPVEEMQTKNQSRAIDPKVEVSATLKISWFKQFVKWIKNRFK